MKCNENEDCQVDCSGLRSCQSATIEGPINGNLSITCNETESCRYATIHAPINGGFKLFITAAGSSSLRDANVYCAGNSSCSIIASGTGSDMLSGLNVYSPHGFSRPLQLQCNYGIDIANCYSELAEPRMMCGSNYGIISQLYLNSGTNELKHIYGDNDADICNDNMPSGLYGTRFAESIPKPVPVFCIDGMDCFVTCGFNHCDGVTIHGPTNGNLSVDCPGRCGCCYAQIYGPTNGDLEVLFGGPDSGAWAKIYGPTNGDLNVLCSRVTNGRNCHTMIADASNMITGSFSLESLGWLQYSTIKCPGNSNECNIFCSVASSCAKMTVLSLDDSKLSIKAIGSSALQLSNIYCPSSGLCAIDVTASGSSTSDMLSQIKIYSPQAFGNLQLRCNYSTNATECYGDTTKPTLSCLPKTDASCAIALESETMDEWQCTDTGANDTVARLCDTMNPSEYPTKYPSKYPTANPTKYPTKYPSNPTANPTKNPTKYPTKYPSNPTANPTKNPANTNLILNCNTTYECSTSIYCPLNANCSVSCNANESCRNAVVYCPRNGACDISCTTDFACYKAVIEGPIDAPLDILCNGTSACEYATIYAHNASSFEYTIGSRGVRTAFNQIIYFPPKYNDTTRAFITAHDSDFGFDLELYAIHGFNDFVIDYKGDYSSHSGTMFYDVGYINSCEFAYGSWTCLTADPTLAPTTPTKDPAVRDGEVRDISTTTGITEVGDDEMDTKSISSLSIIIICALWVFACVMVAVFVYCRWKKKQTVKQEANVIQTQMTDENREAMDKKTMDVVGDVVLVTPDLTDLPPPPPQVKKIRDMRTDGSDEETDDAEEDAEELYDVVHEETSPTKSKGADDEYEWIRTTLQACDGAEWKVYLENFKREKIKDSRLKLIQNGNDDLWKELIPQWGVRLEFQSLYKQKHSEDDA